MKAAEFVALLTANAHKTKNLRVYVGRWCTGVNRIPDDIVNQVGKVIRLLQVKTRNRVLIVKTKIDEGHIIDGSKEGLLIYNFQPIVFHENQFYCSMDMLIRPLECI